MISTAALRDRWIALAAHPTLQSARFRWSAGWLALVLVYWSCYGYGQVWDVDSLRDVGTALDIIERGVLPRTGPAVGKLGFFLSSFYYYVLAAELLIWRHANVFMWVCILVQATSALAMFSLTKRLVGTRIAWIALFLFTGSQAVFASQGLFTHASYAVVCELIGLGALYDAKVLGQSRRFIAAMFFLSAAAQFHMSAFPVLAFAGLVSIASKHQVEWRHAAWSWVAFILPLLPTLGDVSTTANISGLQPVEVCVWILEHNNALAPSIFAILFIARPSLITNCLHLKRFVICWIAWLAWMALEWRLRGEFPLIKLFNLELHRPTPGAQLSTNVGTSSMLTELWTFWQSTDTQQIPFYAFLSIVGLILAATRWGAIRRTDAILSAESSKPTQRFLLLWAAIVAPLNLAMFYGAPTPQSRYLTHLGLIVILLIAIAIDACSEGLRSSIEWLRDGLERRVALTAMVDRVITRIEHADRVPSDATAAALFASAESPPVVRSFLMKTFRPAVISATWGLALLSPSALYPIAYPLARRMVGLRAIALPFIVFGALMLISDRHGEYGSGFFVYDRTMSAVFEFADRVQLGDDFATRLHGTGGGNHLGDLHSTPWYMFARLRKPRPSCDAAPSQHYFFRRLETEEETSGELLPRERLAVTKFRPQLQLSKAQLVSGAHDAIEALSASLPLPLRVAFPHETPVPRGVRFVEQSPFYDDVEHPNANVAITIPRSAGATEASLHVLVSDVASNNSRCHVKALLDGAVLGEQTTETFAAMDLVFPLPASRDAGTVSIEFSDCRYSFIDVFDVPAGT